MASGANRIADENVKSHMRIPSTPLIMVKSPLCTGTMPRLRHKVAPFANLPRVLAPEISGEGAKQLDQKKSFVNTKEAALHDHFDEQLLAQRQEGPNQLLLWTTRSLRSSCATPKSLHTMTPRRSTHIVGLIPSVLVLRIHRLSS